MVVTERAPVLRADRIDERVPVRKANRTDAAQVAEVLCLAFHDDPVFAWAIPDAGRRRAALPGFFAPFVRAYREHDETHVATTPIEAAGVALWAPPGAEPVPSHLAEDFERDVVESVSAEPGDVERMLAVMALLDASHPEAPCFYLNLLGVRPWHQGQGVGSALLRAVLQRCDAEGHAAYLEATSERNRALYERHGFRVRRPLEVPGGPTLWAMWRDPR